MPYSNEPIPSAEIVSILTQNWEENGGATPIPRIFDVGQEGHPLRIDMGSFLQTGRRDLIIIRPISPTMDETPIGNWTYAHRKSRVNIELYSRESKQRLYNLFAEVRRIIHLKMHTTVGYQRIQFVAWNETSEESFNFWVGEVVVELLNSAILLET